MHLTNKQEGEEPKEKKKKKLDFIQALRDN